LICVSRNRNNRSDWGHVRIKSPCVYILASGTNGTLYVGVTSDIRARMAQHAQKLVPGFTARYGVTRLVYFELLETMEQAIRREKQLKEWQRIWKLRLIKQMNPGWLDLFDSYTGDIKPGLFDQSVRSVD
jgi:putative endonuclease